MREQDDVERYRQEQQSQLQTQCPLCEKRGYTDPDCDCVAYAEVLVGAYEGCVPRDFWRVTAADVHHNTDVFKEVIMQYCDRLAVARRRGYGLLLLGDNGVGKTLFLSYVLMKVIRAGMSAYYTTLPQLDFDLKRGFSSSTAAARLEWLLSSDFVALDEMGKEKFRDGDSYMRTQIERILKRRFDDSLPTLVATNCDQEALHRIYGPTLASMFTGKFQAVTLEPGDFREHLAGRMRGEMGFDG